MASIFFIIHFQTNAAMEVIKTINSPNLKIMLDLFHLQMIRGNITNTIKEIMDYVGHIQIAQAPGELNIPFFYFMYAVEKNRRFFI